ncbi:MAG: RluA family pseudouridine synthase [Clostridiales bacterium]|nr:RluA family pseudouridine synthase [Clostridiales bacterium]
MREIEFEIAPKDAGRQIKHFLYDFGVSSALLIKLKNTPGAITLENVPARAIDLLKAGDRLKISLPETGAKAAPADISLDILYEDEDIAAVNKPPGMPVHESRNHRGDALSNAFAFHTKSNAAFRAVYRLDKNTSGIVLLAKHALAAAKLAGRVKKDYYAIAAGKITAGGEICLPIKREAQSIIKRCVAPGGESAVTKYEVISCGDTSTFLKINLETGRTHQIRVHFSAIGHPLLGDDLYGASLQKIKRQALHCKDIYFNHPVTGQNMHISCPFPADFRAAAAEHADASILSAEKD